jgi:hypothetical protein
MRRSWIARLLVLLSVTLTACGHEDSELSVHFASGFVPKGSSVSLFGVFKDGRMSSDAWEEMGPLFARSLGNGACDLAYGADLVATKPDLSSAVDDYTRANGVTEDLLARFASTAQGDVIITFTVAGQPPAPAASTTAPQTAPGNMAQPPRRGGGSRGGRRGRGSSTERRARA